MTPAERMRKYRARKHLRAAWERAIRAGVDPHEVMSVTPIGVTAARSGDPVKLIADAFDAIRAGESYVEAARIAGITP